MSASGRVLILAASLRDATSTCEILSREGIECVKCDSFAHLERELEVGAGALLFAKEVLTPTTLVSLTRILEEQPTWSFLPIIVLISAGDLEFGNEHALRYLKPLQNATFLERPVRVSALMSVINAALRDRRRQYDLRSFMGALEFAKDEAERANMAKTAFLANMSHEIRTPLGAILGFSELMFEPGNTEDDRATYMRTVKRNGQLLLALIDDILDLAKVESGHISTEKIDFSFSEMVAEVMSALQPKALEKRLPLIVEGIEFVPSVIQTDPVRLKQIILNVVGNALKFTTRGQVKITFSSVQMGGREGTLTFDVADTGLGISQAQAARLFQPFAQADDSITRKFGGTGLGLVLSKKLANLLGGDLSLSSSEPGVGSTFTASVHISSDHWADKSEPTQEIEEVVQNFIDRHQLAGKSILVADDSAENRFLISHMLTSAGADVDLACDGIEAVKKAAEGNYHVVLMDIQMPRLGGYEATRNLRDRGYIRPIIALTAHALREDRERCLVAGCDFYLTKPANKQELVQTVYRFAEAAVRPGLSSSNKSNRSAAAQL